MNYGNQAGSQAKYSAPQAGSSLSGSISPNKTTETVASKLRELDVNLSELTGQARILANSLAGCEPEDPRCEPPAASDVSSQLDALRRLGREIGEQIRRANQAVGN